MRVNALVAKAQKVPEEGWTMQDGTPWPGNNTRDHPGMIQVRKLIACLKSCFKVAKLFVQFALYFLLHLNPSRSQRPFATMY